MEYCNLLWLIELFLERDVDKMKKRYERGLNRSYFVLESESVVKKNFEMKMMEQNQIKGLLPLEIKEGENGTSYRYLITSLTALSDILEWKKLNEDDLRKMIIEFHKLMYVLPEYLLDEERVMIDPEFIFVNPKDETWNFCYTFEKKKSAREQLREFLSQILSHINHDDHNAVVLGYQLLKVSQKEEFVYSDLLDVLNQCVLESQTESTGKKPEGNHPVNQNGREEIPALRDSTDEMTQMSDIWNVSDGESMQKHEMSNQTKAFRFMDWFRFGERKKKDVPVLDKTERVSEEEKQWITYLSEYDDRQEVEEVEHTTLLSERVKELETKELHILKSLSRNIKDIELSYFPFVIGKQERVCDYVIPSGSISRLHLKIDCIDGKYYVRDLNSLNGTKLRGELIPTEKEEEIFENDELDIAGVKFVFV